MSIEDWQPWKALATLISIVAVAGASAFAVGYWIARTPQTINVHLDAPLVAPRTGG